jgi:hypothetical protein
MSFERYFGRAVPDSEAEKLDTVGDAAAWFSQQLGIAEQRHSVMRSTVAAQFISELPPGAWYH